MREHGSRGSILDLGVRDDADCHSKPPLDQAGDGLDFRIIKRIERAIGIDAHGVDRRFVTGGVGAGRVCRIRNDRIGPGGRHQCHMRHVVHCQLAPRLAFCNALRQQARGDPMRRRHAVADEQDYVLGLSLTGGVDVPGDLARDGTVRHAHFVVPWLRKRNIAQDQSRLILAVLARDETGGVAERLGVVLAID